MQFLCEFLTKSAPVPYTILTISVEIPCASHATTIQNLCHIHTIHFLTNSNKILAMFQDGFCNFCTTSLHIPYHVLTKFLGKSIQFPKQILTKSVHFFYTNSIPFPYKFLSKSLQFHNKFHTKPLYFLYKILTESMPFPYKFCRKSLHNPRNVLTTSLQNPYIFKQIPNKILTISMQNPCNIDAMPIRMPYKIHTSALQTHYKVLTSSVQNPRNIYTMSPRMPCKIHPSSLQTH